MKCPSADDHLGDRVDEHLGSYGDLVSSAGLVEWLVFINSIPWEAPKPLLLNGECSSTPRKHNSLE